MKVVVAGLGNMGQSHALAYHAHPDAEIVGLVNRSAVELPEALQGYPRLGTFEEGLALAPDLVCIATYSDSHAQDAIAATGLTLDADFLDRLDRIFPGPGAAPEAYAW